MKHQSQRSFEGTHAEPGNQAGKGLDSLDPGIDPVEIEKHIATARRLRAEATASIFRRVFSWLFIFQGKNAKPEESSSPRDNQALPV